MVDVMDCYVTYVCPHQYCTKPKQCFLYARYLIADRLKLMQPQIRYAPGKKPLLLNLNKALVGNYKNAEIPADPTREKDN